MSGLRNVHEVIILNYVELLILWQNVNVNQVPSVLITLEVVRGVGGGGEGGGLVMEEGIVIPGKRLSRAINDCDADAYKYLGMLDGDNIKHTEMSYWCLRT